MANLPNTVAYPNGHDPPRHLLEGVFQGMSELSGHAWHGLHTATKQPLRYAAREGLTGAGKGVVIGALSFAESLADGVLDMASYVIEGVRNTPEALADYVAGEDRLHYRHLVDRQEGRMLETYLDRQPQHLPDGAKVGARALVKGLMGGSTSFVVKNVQAVERVEYLRDIPSSLSDGMLQGVTGFTTKAAASSLDFAEAVVDGARNTPDYVRWQAFPQVEIQSVRIANSGYDVVVNAAQKAGQLERAVREQASSAWQHRPRLGLTPLGAPAAVPSAQAQSSEPPLASRPLPGSLPPRPCDASPPAPARPAPASEPAAAPVPAAALPVPAAAAAAVAAAAARRAARLAAAGPDGEPPESALSETTMTSRDRESLLRAVSEVAGGGYQPAGTIFPQPARGASGPRPALGLVPEAGWDGLPYAPYLAGYSDPHQMMADTTASGYAQYPAGYSDMHQMVADRVASRYAQYPAGYSVPPQSMTEGATVRWSYCDEQRS